VQLLRHFTDQQHPEAGANYAVVQAFGTTTEAEGDIEVLGEIDPLAEKSPISLHLHSREVQ